jgi:hypothetical protein
VRLWKRLNRIAKPRSVIILPLESGDTALDSDIEDIPDCLANDEVIFETADEAEVEYCQSNESESDEQSDDEVVCQTAPKRRKKKQRKRHEIGKRV